MTALFHFSRDNQGRPAARPATAAHSGLARFLTEEASWPDYIDLLLDCAATAARTGKAETNTGNAYTVTIDRGAARIEHLHRANDPAETVALPVFVETLRRWRAFLDQPGTGA